MAQRLPQGGDQCPKASRGQGAHPLDRRLFLPKDWADDPARRETCRVPDELVFRKSWEIAAELLARSGAEVPHGWVVGDDELGRPAEFRTLLRQRGERYVLDVPCNTLVCDLNVPRPTCGKGQRDLQPSAAKERTDLGGDRRGDQRGVAA